MAFDLRHLNSDRRTVSREFAGETLEITYRPGAVSHKLLSSLRSAATAAAAGDDFAEVDAIEALVGFIADAVVAWNLTDDGEPVAVSREAVSALPLEVVGLIWTAIQEDIGNPGKARKTSGGGSPRKASGPRKTAGPRPKPGR
jgi:hypothetical protein